MYFRTFFAVAVTNQPSNESELQLYRVLQRANLLSYYDVFIAQGGDDVHQLLEAGEDEFLEIMALVGMASKPLHVRRLQKALQEWLHHPGRGDKERLSIILCVALSRLCQLSSIGQKLIATPSGHV